MAEAKMPPLPNSNAKSVKAEEVNIEKEEEKVVAVAKGTVKKKTFGEKIREVFVGEDIQNVGDYILKEVIVPTIKNTVVDIVQNGISLLIFGESRPADKRRQGQYVSYGSYSSNTRRNDRRDYHDSRDSNPSDSRDIIFDSRADASAVLDRMCDIVDTYDACTIANYYEAADVPSNYQDRKWGWTDLRRVEVRPARGGGWYIDLPRAEYLN